MKKYLNRDQKRQFVQLAATSISAESMVNEWYAHDNMTKDEKRWLLTSSSFIKKAMSSIVRRLDEGEAEKLVRVASQTSCVCIPKESESQFRKKIEREAKTAGVWVGKETLDAIIDMALCKGCMPCKMKDSKTNCPLRMAMIELDVPKYDENPDDGICPWEIVI